MPRFPLRAWLSGLGLGLALTLLLSLNGGAAVCDPNNADQSRLCSAQYEVLAGQVTSLTVPVAPPGPAVPRLDGPRLPSSGPLVYADFTRIEAQARDLLRNNMRFRQDISPYQGENNNFDEIVRQFDTRAGFNQTITDPAGLTMTLQQRIDKADNELRQARDLYAFLAVYAPESRMRGDSAYVGTTPPGYSEPLCGLTDKEDPDPPDPNFTGQVLPPVIDWCNFPARLRQAVRESAQLRMIFAQQFMVDALGLDVSASLLGLDDFVRKEKAKLEAAVNQQDLAMQALLEAVDRAVGDGCLVSDFFGQAEWSLLSRAMEGKEQAKHHIAVRVSYLDIGSPDQVPRAQADAQAQYRQAVTDGYGRLVNTAGLATRQPSGGCAKGTRPDGALLADMAVNLVETRERSRELAAGRNVFGFDISFTPARPYHTASGTTDEGLYEQAEREWRTARDFQIDAATAARAYDQMKIVLGSEINNLQRDVDNQVQMAAGCDYQTAFNYNTPEYVKCVEKTIEEAQACDVKSDGFDACMNRTTDGRPADPEGTNLVVPISDLRTARQQLRVSWLSVVAAQKAVDNLQVRLQTEIDRNATVTSATLTNGLAQSALDFVSTLLDSVSVDSGGEVSANPAQPVIAAAVAAKTITQMVTDIQIQNAESAAVQKNLILDAAEAMVGLSSAAAQYEADLSDYRGVIGQTRHDLQEAQRMRAYVAASPANDPAYRITRDSKRLSLGRALERATRTSYLAARRAEFEYGARLSASNFRVSDIYKARSADDVREFLDRLESTVQNLPAAVRQASIAPAPLTISVAQHVLNLTDPATRADRFRAWVAANTTLEANSQGVLKPVLRFQFSTQAGAGGVISRVIPVGYDFWWKHTLTGMGVNLLTAQPGLGYRSARVSQQGQVQLRTFAGCIFDYRLIPPAAMLGLEYPASQPTDTVAGIFYADVNTVNGQAASGFTTPAFRSRPVAASTWEVVIYGGSPDGLQPDMDLQQLTDIELKLQTEHASRASNVPPALRDCVRSDF